jgi:hypothetical protein
MVDTAGLLIAVHVTPANVHDPAAFPVFADKDQADLLVHPEGMA